MTCTGVVDLKAIAIMMAVAKTELGMMVRSTHLRRRVALLTALRKRALGMATFTVTMALLKIWKST